MKLIYGIALGIILLAFGSFVTFGGAFMYGAMMHGHMTTPCKFMSENEICRMAPLEHLRQIKNLTIGVIPTSFLLIILFAISIVALLKNAKRRFFDYLLSFLFFSRKWTQLGYVALTHSPPREYNPLLRSLGKIHPRLYA